MTRQAIALAVDRAGVRVPRALSIVPPAVTVIAAAAALPLAYGTSGRDVALFVGYQLGFVLLPGLLVYVAVVRPRSLGVREVALGWALGYAVEIGAYTLCAALGVRGAFDVYPLVLAAACVPAIARQPPQRWRAPRVGGAGWLVVLSTLVALAFAASLFYAETPLPNSGHAVSYHPDYVWALSMAAEARHHWPITIPDVSGVPFQYHYFVYLHLAAVNQVTGIDLWTVMFRLFSAPAIVLTMLLVACLARGIGGRRAAVLGPVLAVVVGPLTPVIRYQPVGMPSQLFAALGLGSPTYQLGLLLVLAVLVELFAAPRREGWGSWLVIAGLMAAAAGAKATVLPLLAGASALVVGVQLARRRFVERTQVVVGALATGAFGLGTLLLYPHARGGLFVAPFRAEMAEPWMQSVLSALPDALRRRPVTWPLAAVVGTAEHLLPLLPGLVLWARLGRRSRGASYLLALTAVSLVPFFALDHWGASQYYFLWAAYPAAAVVSAAGIARLGSSRLLPSPRRVIVASGLVLALALVAIGARQLQQARFLEGGRGAPGYALPDLMSPGLYDGLRWIARTAPTDAVLAVNNAYQDAAKTDPRYCYYTAFAERRALLGCETGASASYGIFFPTYADALRRPAQHPYARRFQLNQELFAGSRSALRIAARDYGVRYVVLDLLHGGTKAQARRLANEAHVVVRNRSVVIFAVPAAEERG